MKRNLFLAAVMLTLCNSAGLAYDTYQVPSTSPLFKFNIYNEGETFVDGEGTHTAPFTLNTNQRQALFDSATNWDSILNVIPKPTSDKIPVITVVPFDDFNASATSKYVNVAGSDYKITAINAYINSKTITDKDVTPQGNIEVGKGIFKEHPGWNFYQGKETIYHAELPDLYTTISHEMYHALGLCSGAEKEDVYHFSNSNTENITIWDKNLRIYQQNMTLPFDSSKLLAPEKGMSIKTEEGEAGTFDILTYSPYFAGNETLKVISGIDDTDINMQAYIHSKGGLKNYSIYYSESSNAYPSVLGLPINGLEDDTKKSNNKESVNNENDDDDPGIDAELSHIELHNSFMSHQDYRNWTILMEAELAVLKDIGYKGVELRKHFGKSYYLNGDGKTPSIFNTGFGEWNGTSYSGYSTIENGIGLHIYGDNNVIDQQCNTLSKGNYAIGTRIDGVGNKYYLTNSLIEFNGKDSIGIATTWGKNHNITIDKGSKVIASGEGGIGASFDFGKNIIGAYAREKGSYSQYKEKNITPDVDTQGALVDNFTVAGTLTGSKAAINISDNAHVANINIVDGATINGNIISKWNSVKSGLNMRVQRKNTSGEWIPIDTDKPEEIYYTNLNFAGNTILNGNIDGTNDVYNTLILNNNTDTTSSTTGNLIYNGEELSVYTINNKGNIVFNNSIDVPLKLSVQNGSIEGTGSLIFNNGVNLSTINYIQNTVDVNNTSLSLLDNTKNRIDINKLNADSADLYIDYGDKFVLQNKSDIKDPLAPTLERKDNLVLKQIAVSLSDADSLDETEQIKLFEEKDMTTPHAITLNVASSANFYNNKNRYTFSQDTKDKSYLKITKTTGNFELADAIADNTTANYIVDEEDTITKDLGTVQGNKFEISGDDIDVNGHKGLIVDGTTNSSTVLKTNIYGASDSDITLLNNADITITSKDEDVVIGKSGEVALTIDNSLFNAEVENNNLTINGEIRGLNTNTNNKILLAGNTVNLQRADNVTISAQAQTTNINNILTSSILQISGGITNVKEDSYLNSDSSNIIIANGGTLNLLNNKSSAINLSKMIMNSDLDTAIDVDLKAHNSDAFVFLNKNDLITNGHTLNIKNINLANQSTVITEENCSIPIISPKFNNTNFLGATTYSGMKKIMTPIFQYELNYTENDGYGSISMERGPTSDYQSYNPAVMASPIAAQIGGYLTQLNSYDEAFRNMDMYMLMSKKDRQALKLRNKIASVEGGNIAFDPTMRAEEKAGGWFRPYATFEKVNLHNGPKVENTAYGSFFGGESEMKDLGHGWDGMWGAYVGYNGSHQNYDGIGIYQNGGTLGLVGMAYKGNFFIGTTINAGANAGEASTMYGSDNFTMLMAGIAAKTGYNWELANGKFIIQPSLQLSYSFVNTFDYTNSAGVRIDSDPLNAIAIEPGVKFIGNLKNGWQPYAGVSVIINAMDKANFNANDVTLPSLSINPYVKYGLGIRKTWGERLTGFFQTFITNGGRNGVGLQAGFRWAIGKDS